MFTISATLREGIAPAVRVFTGASLTNLSLVAETGFGPSDPDYSKRVVFNATAATIYQIALASLGGSYDLAYDLTVTPSVPPTIVIRNIQSFFEAEYSGLVWLICSCPTGSSFRESKSTVTGVPSNGVSKANLRLTP